MTWKIEIIWNIIPAKAGIQTSQDMGKQPAVYILASQRNGTLYIGVTSNLPQRIWEHKQDTAEGFTKQYQVHTLVHYERFDEMRFAIAREKQMKKWNRAWKVRLIEEQIPEWKDLYHELR